MLKSRLLLLFSAAGLVAILFYLPRVVVDNDEGSMSEVAQRPRASSESDINPIHSQSLTPESQGKADLLKASLEKAESQENLSIFADSLAELYLDFQIYDSAAKYFEKAANLDPTLDRWSNAGNAYYEAFTYAIDQGMVEYYGQKARECFQPVLVEEPNRNDLKTKIGMTLVSSSNPMEGITMLREILEDDPENQDALLNLGILAFQTRQFNTAIGRFENLVSIDDNHTSGHFYLAMSYFEVGEMEKAKQQFLIVKDQDQSEEVQATVDSYLEEIE